MNELSIQLSLCSMGLTMVNLLMYGDDLVILTSFAGLKLFKICSNYDLKLSNIIVIILFLGCSFQVFKPSTHIKTSTISMKWPIYICKK